MFTRMEKVIELFVPGRLCLFGEHSDWAGLHKTMNADIVPGRAIVTGIEQGIYATACKSDSFRFEVELEGLKNSSFECEMDMHRLREVAKSGGFFSYVAGVASYMCEWYQVGGVTIKVTDMTLPMKSGLSSSAAVCVLVTRAFNELYHLQLNTQGIMNIAYWGEQRTPSRCGRLDQACAFGVNPISMDFDGNEIDVELITLKEPLYYVFADLMSSKDTIRILADLSRAYPFAHTQMEREVQKALGEDNREITARAIQYMENGNTQSLGRLMTEAQELFDERLAPMCPEELTAPVLHSVLNDERIKELTYGAKGVGSQGDGTAQFLAKDADTQRALCEYLEKERGMKAYSLTLQPKALVRKAVIPVAGFGTRLYPQTRAVKKEFCPVIDKDGLVKPAILVLLEELDAIGIEEICLIINEEEKAFYQDYFSKPLSEEHYAKLPVQMKEYEKKIVRIGKKLSFCIQKEQKGFGHAVYQSMEFANGEPVLLLLGDTIYQSNTDVPCTKQLIDRYEKYGRTMVAVHDVPVEDVVHYGIFAGNWEDREFTVMNLNRIAEKPSVEYAQDYMGMAKKAGKPSYYAAFGAYVITKEVYERLGQMVEQDLTDRGEIQLTAALEYVCDKNGMMAFVPDGRSFDIGNAKAYRSTVAEFGR